MFICPQCRCHLLRTQNEVGIYWACPSCGGCAISVAVLRKATTPEFVNQVWNLARAGQGAPARLCPMCEQSMIEVMPAEALHLDVCQRCSFLWFDPDELAATPPPHPPEPPRPGEVEAPLSPRAREALAEIEIASIKERAQGDMPEESWKQLAGYFGLPVESEVNAFSRWPWVTWALAATIAVSSIAAFFNLRTVVWELGFIPAEPLRHGGLTLVTSFFIHAGIWHLIGNLYFFVIFGDNVEDYLGRKKFLLLLAAAALFGDLLHLIGDPRSDVPCIGASGGISGIIAFYALKFPDAQLHFMMRYGAYPVSWFRLTAKGAFLFWICLQVFGAYQQASGFSSVSAFAHIGGAACGFFAWVAWRDFDTKPEKIA